MLAYVGVDPKKDIDWVLTQSVANNMQFFVEGRVDALIAFPPQPQKLREMKLGRVIVDGTHDRPWSQYTCCVVAGARTSSRTILSLPNARCERSSKPRIYARKSRSELPAWC